MDCQFQIYQIVYLSFLCFAVFCSSETQHKWCVVQRETGSLGLTDINRSLICFLIMHFASVLIIYRGQIIH